nr:ATP-binding cassette sub-family G member 2-like [Meriones unguiculatus]
MSSSNDHVLVPMSQRNTNGLTGMNSSNTKTHTGDVLSFRNITYRVKVKSGFLIRKTVEKEILSDINGIMKPGLNAILGPTGGGKSSLLDILAARKDPRGLSGDVLINGAPQPANFKCCSGYVVQVSISRFQLYMCKPSGLCPCMIVSLHDCVHALPLLVGYHCEAYNNPADFFLDVINGDSSAVILNREEEDHEANKTEEPSKREKPIIENLVEFYASSSIYRETKAELDQLPDTQKKKGISTFKEPIYATSFCHQLRWIAKRSFKNLLGNPQASIAQVIVTAVLGLVIGAIYFNLKNDPAGIQNRAGVLFFLTTNQCFSSVSAVELFVVEKKLFIHEYIGGYYRVSSYFFGKLISDLLPMRLLPSVIYTCIVYFMLGLKKKVEAFFIMMFTLIMVAYTASSMALAIAAGQSVVSVATLLMTISFVFMMIFSGLLVNLRTIEPWLSWLQYFSIPRYGFTALQHNEFLGQDFCPGLNTTANSTCVNSYTICTGDDHLKNQGIDLSPWGLWKNHVALACMSIIFLTIAYLKLVFLKKYS